MCGPDKSTAVPCHNKQQYAEEESFKPRIDASLEEELSPSNCCLLELAAENDLERFRRHVEESNCQVDVVGSWYVRLHRSRQMLLEWRTPTMIAALYGSLDVLNFIVKRYALFGGELNQKCGHDGSTALHCAAAGGSKFALEVVRILVESGADPTICDAFGRQPCDVIDVPFWLCHIRKGLMELLKLTRSSVAREFSDNPDMYLPQISSDERGQSPEDENNAEASAPLEGSPSVSGSWASALSSISPSSLHNSLHAMGAKPGNNGTDKVRDYPIDPSLPDIKSGIYSTDEFRMYSFKIRPCARAYSHDWTECPFVHPGENARRRDPRRYYYSCVPCPEFRKGFCRKGDMCEYAHGVFECWLHPAQYRIRFCKDGTSCNRRVCFFAHTAGELRSLYESIGSDVPSSRSSAFVDMALKSPSLASDSPSILPPYAHLQSAHAIYGKPPMSPSLSSSSLIRTRANESIPFLQLPGASVQSSTLRTFLTARSASVSDSLASIDFKAQNLNDLQPPSAQSLSTQACLNVAVAASCLSSNAAKYKNLVINVVSNNIEESVASGSFPIIKCAGPDSSVLSQFEAQLPAYGWVPFSPVSARTQQLYAQQTDSETHFSRLLKSSAFSLGSLSQVSSFGGPNAEGQAKKEVPMLPALTAARAAFAQQDKGSHSSRDLGTKEISSEWGAAVGKLEWGVHSAEMCELRKSSSFGF